MSEVKDESKLLTDDFEFVEVLSGASVYAEEIPEENIFQKHQHDLNEPSTSTSNRNQKSSAIQRSNINYVLPQTTNGPSYNKENTVTHDQIKDTGLKLYLENDDTGKAILKAFHENGYLPKKLRNMLSRVVIQRERNNALKNVPVLGQLDEFKITTERFETLATEVEHLFPGESKYVYYSPFKTVNGIRTPTTGILWEYYNYQKKVMRNLNMLSVSCRTPATEHFPPPSIHEIDNIEWLKCHHEPWHEVCQRWKDSFTARRKLLLIDHTRMHEYCNLFPSLRLQEGQQLLQEDFDTLFPEKGSLLLNRWHVIKTIITDELTKAKISSIEDKAYVHILPLLDNEKQEAVLFYLLPHLIQAQRFGKKRGISETNMNPTRKLSIEERRNCFLLHIKNETEFHLTVERLKDDLRSRNQMLQPMVAVVGPLTNIETSYVIFNDITYQVPSCLRAFDLALKIFFATDGSYPPDAYHLWLFIQKSGFCIEVPGDKPNTSLRVLLGFVDKAFATNT